MKKVIFFGGLLCLSTLANSKPTINFKNTLVLTEIVSVNEEDENEITLNLEEESEVSIKIYDLQGNMIKAIKNKVTLKAGEHHFYVSLSDYNLKRGSYFRKVSVNGKIQNVKMITL